MGNFEIRVKGKKYNLWETASYQRSIDALCGTFNFTSVDKSGEYPVKSGDEVEIYIANQLQLTGFVDELRGGGTTDTALITVMGRDITQDIVDSSVPDVAKVLEGPIGFEQICDTVIAGLGLFITTLDEVGIREFTADELESGASGENAFDFLQDLARKLQVYLITDPEGNLIIYRPGGVSAVTPLIHQRNGENNNVKRWDVKFSTKNRYRKYSCRSQDNVGADENADYSGDGNDRSGLAYDEDIRDSRYLELSADENMEDTECTERAKEESNVRRARGLEYKALVVGNTQSDGSVWQIGQIIKVVDEIAGVRGFFLIRTVNFDSQKTSETTQLTMAPLDAYKVSDVVPPTILRKSNMGGKFRDV